MGSWVSSPDDGFTDFFIRPRTGPSLAESLAPLGTCLRQLEPRTRWTLTAVGDRKLTDLRNTEDHGDIITT